MLRQLKCETGLADAKRPFEQKRVVHAAQLIRKRDELSLPVMTKNPNGLDGRLDAVQRVMLFRKLKCLHGLPFSERRRRFEPVPERRS